MAVVVRPDASAGSRGPWLAEGFRIRYARDLAPARCRFRSTQILPSGGHSSPASRI